MNPYCPKEIKNNIAYGKAFLRRHYPTAFDPEAAILTALAVALYKFDPLRSPASKFRSYYTYKLKYEGDDAVHMAANLKRKAPFTAALNTTPNHTLPFSEEPSHNPYPLLHLQIDVARALSHIPPLHRRILINHLILDHSLRDISIVLSIPYHILRKYYHESLLILRESLEGYEEDY